MTQDTPRKRNRTWLYGTAKQLTEGDRISVITSVTERSLTVSEAPEHVTPEVRYDGLLIRLEGYGTTYELKIPDKDDQAALLSYPSGNLEVVKHISIKDEKVKVVSTKTAADLGIPQR